MRVSTPRMAALNQLNHNPENTMSERVVHLAGPPAGFHFKPHQEETRIVQRCLLCGEKLIEKVLKKGQKGRKAFWDPGDHVVLNNDGTAYSILPRDSGLLPKDSCAYLVESDPERELTDKEKEELAEDQEALKQENDDEEEE